MSDGPIIKGKRASRSIASGPPALAASGLSGSIAPTVTLPSTVPTVQPGKTSKNSAVFIVLSFIIAMAIPAIFYLLFLKKPAEVQKEFVNTPPTPPVEIPRPPSTMPDAHRPVATLPAAILPVVISKPVVDPDATLAAVRSIAAYWRRASEKVDEIRQSRKDKLTFEKFPDMKSAVDAANDDIAASQKLIAQYKRKSAEEAAIVLKQATLDRAVVQKVIRDEQQTSANQGNDERQNAATAVLDMLEAPPANEDGFVGHAMRNLDRAFPRE